MLKTLCCLTPFLLIDKQDAEIETRRGQVRHQLEGAAECLLRRFGITCARMCHAADFMKSSHTWKLRDQTFRLGNDITEMLLIHAANIIRDYCLIELHCLGRKMNFEK